MNLPPSLGRFAGAYHFNINIMYNGKNSQTSCRKTEIPPCWKKKVPPCWDS